MAKNLKKLRRNDPGFEPPDFDVAAAARNAASEPGRETFAAHWPAIAEKWRLKQLQYTWLRAITGAHADFWQVTRDGLDYALDVFETLPICPLCWRSRSTPCCPSSAILLRE